MLANEKRVLTIRFEAGVLLSKTLVTKDHAFFFQFLAALDAFHTGKESWKVYKSMGENVELVQIMIAINCLFFVKKYFID